MSAADGRLSALNATSWAWTAFSRASKARAIAPVTSGFSSRSCGELAERLLAARLQPLAQSLDVVVGHRAESTPAVPRNRAV